MYLHVVHSEYFTLWGTRRYRLTVRAYGKPGQLSIIHRHRLDDGEIFFDPIRQQLIAEAEATHEQAKSAGLFVTKPRDALRVCGLELRAATTAIKAMRAFELTVGDILRGVVITHRSLSAIRHIESVIIESIDGITRTVEAAANYSDAAEDIFAPDADDPETVPPAEWTRVWKR